MNSEYERMVLEAKNNILLVSTILTLEKITTWTEAINSMALLWDMPYEAMEDQVIASMVWSRQFAPDELNEAQKRCFDYVLHWYHDHFQNEFNQSGSEADDEIEDWLGDEDDES